MLRTKTYYDLKNTSSFKTKLLKWAQKYCHVLWLDSNNSQDTYGKYKAVLAAGMHSHIKITDTTSSFYKLKTYHKNTKDWCFGYLSYDLKNDIESLVSEHEDALEAPEIYMFQPKKVFLIFENHVEMQYLKTYEKEINTDFKAIQNINAFSCHENTCTITPRWSKTAYINQVETIKRHIARGNVYEVTCCQEFFSKGKISPLETYHRLNAMSSPPMASFIKLKDLYVLSASPERYLQKKGSRIISQPIKGTIKRGLNIIEDNAFKQQLMTDEKERSENIMIVDLVRNDLSKIAKKGTVKVDELCGIYTFKQVHQMISTISAEVKKNIHPVDIIKATFPMGSMTGAPKLSAMKLIDMLEITKRGIYSGAVGYFTPDNDFDFSVVIRTILYNAQKKYASFSVGSAITAKSDPHKEYEECLLKGYAMVKALQAKISKIE